MQKFALLKVETQHRAVDLLNYIFLCLCRSVKSVLHETTSLALHLGSLCNSRKFYNIYYYISQQLNSVFIFFYILTIYINGVYAYGLYINNKNLYKSQHFLNRSLL